MATGNGPFGVGAKLPTRTASAEVRLCRLEEAKAFLRQHLAHGSQPAIPLLRAAKTAGITTRTLHRAQEVLGVRAEHTGWHGQWVWRPPAAERMALQGAMPAR